MSRNAALLHRVIGLVFVVVFLLTGAYMRVTFPAAWRGDVGMRMMFRSAHIYIALTALLNLVASAGASARTALPRLRAAGSALLVLSPLLFTGAFFFEPAPDTFKRPFVLFGLIVTALGAALFTIAAGRQAPHEG